MSDPEATDTNWKAKGAAAVSWMRLHPDITIPIACFIAGAILGALVF